MTSVPKLLILITAITTISGEAHDFGIDKVQSKALVSRHKELIDTLSRLKLIVPDYDELEFMWPFRTNIDVVLPSLKADTTNTNSIVGQQGNRRERRQALVKPRRIDDGPGSQSLDKSIYPYKVPRFPNGDVVNGAAINREVINWIRDQLIRQMMSRILEFKIHHPLKIPALNVDRIVAR